MVTLTTLKRVFKVGAMQIEDPMPAATLTEVVRQLSLNFPQFRWTTILEEDGTMLDASTVQYELVLPPPKVNG